MADSLYELLAPYLQSNATASQRDASTSATINRYLTRLTTLPLSALSTTEPQSLGQSSQTNLLSLQALASRSHRSVTASAGNLSTLHSSVPAVTASAGGLRDAIPQLDEKVVKFSTTFSKSKEDNELLDRRKKAMLLARNVDRLSDVLELPTLLSATIASAGSGTTGAANYSQALDLFAHMKRLQILYPDSAIVKYILLEAEDAMKAMTSNLITSLRGQNIRLAAAIRTIGWLRRVAPDLDHSTLGRPEGLVKASAFGDSEEGLFGSLFLTARLANLLHMLEALAPLRDLADQETSRRTQKTSSNKTGSAAGYIYQGQQTERYLKRYIEIFREQSFPIVSMYRNVFPVSDATKTSSTPVLPIPSALASFPLHLVELLMETLRSYLPNVTDATARESLLVQVLYAAGSLGRLGADFTMMVALLDDELEEVTGQERNAVPVADEGEENEEKEEKEEEVEETRQPEWVSVIQKHRVQSARMEALKAGQDQLGLRRGSNEVMAT